MTGHEAKPKTSVTPSKASQLDHLANRRDGHRINQWCQKHGVQPNTSDHIDEDGNNLIGADGLRHIFLPSDSDSQGDNQAVQRYIKLGYTVKATKDGFGYEMTIPQDAYEANMAKFQKAATDRVTQRSRRAAEEAKRAGAPVELATSLTEMDVDSFLAGD